MTDTVTVAADDVATVTAVFDVAARAFGSTLGHIPGFGAALEACSRMQAASAQASLPQDPVSGPDEVAIRHHELMSSYERAGFSEDQAFVIALAYIQASAQGHALRSLGG